MKTIDIVCPHCAAASKWDVPIEPVVFGCAQCHRNFQKDTSGYFVEQPAFTKVISQVKPDWFIPGTKVEISNRKYTVISIYCYGVNWQEWDSEAGWESGYGEYLEWYLVASDGKELWLEESDHSNYLGVNEYVPVTRHHTDTVKNSPPEPADIREMGRYGLVGFTGIDDEPLDRGNWNYKVVKSATGDASVEWQDNAPISQWRAYSNKSNLWKQDLERGRVLSAENLAELKENTKNLGFFRDVFGYASIAMLVLMGWSFLFGSDKALFHEAWIFSAYQPQGADTSLTIIRQYSRELGSVQLKQGVAYRFETQCVFDQNDADADFTLVMLKMPEGKPVNAIGASFFSETGTDDEGAWKEATLSDYFQFTVEEDGEYLVEARVEPQSDFPAGKSGSLTVSIYPVILSRYFIFFFLVVVLSWLILQWRWEFIAIRSKSDASGWLLRMFGK